jgi:hypothetical protein
MFSGRGQTYKPEQEGAGAMSDDEYVFRFTAANGPRTHKMLSGMESRG